MGSSILTVLGIIFLLIIVVAVFLLFVFWRKIKGFIREVAQEAGSSSGTPQTIHLNEVDAREWLKEENAEAIFSVLKERGYREGKVYEVSEIGGVLLLALCNPQNGSAASIIHHDTIGTWFELNSETESLSISYSNSRIKGFTRYPEWLEMHYLSDMEPSEIITEFEARIRGEKIVTYQLEEFRDRYEFNYRRMMKWRNESGGTSFEEVKKQNDLREEPLDDEKLAEAYLTVKTSEFNAWTYAMWEELHTNHELEYPDEPTFIVPDHAYCEAFVDYIEDYLDLTEKQLAEIRGLSKGRMDCGVFFDEILSRISERLRPREFCRIEFPLSSRVFIENKVEINKLEEPEDE